MLIISPVLQGMAGSELWLYSVESYNHHSDIQGRGADKNCCMAVVLPPVTSGWPEFLILPLDAFLLLLEKTLSSSPYQYFWEGKLCHPQRKPAYRCGIMCETTSASVFHVRSSLSLKTSKNPTAWPAWTHGLSALMCHLWSISSVSQGKNMASSVYIISLKWNSCVYNFF